MRPASRREREVLAAVPAPRSRSIRSAWRQVRVGAARGLEPLRRLAEHLHDQLRRPCRSVGRRRGDAAAVAQHGHACRTARSTSGEPVRDEDDRAAGRGHPPDRRRTRARSRHRSASPSARRGSPAGRAGSSAFAISTSCRSPMLSVGQRLVRVDALQAHVVEHPAAAGRPPSRRRLTSGTSMSPSSMFSSTVSAGTTLSSWSTSATPEPLGGLSAAQLDRLAVDQDAAAVRARAGRTASSPRCSCRRRCARTGRGSRRRRR